MSRPRQRLSASQVEQLVQWREAGRSLGFIAGKLGVSSGAVNYQCLKHGAVSPRQRRYARGPGMMSTVRQPSNGNRYFSAEEDKQLLALEARGLTMTEISRAMVRTKTSVRMRLMLLAQHEELASS